MLDKYFGIPLLRAVPLDLDVRQTFKESVILALAVNAMVPCIWMVVNINKF